MRKIKKGRVLSSQVRKVEGGYSLSGELDFNTVPVIWKESEAMFTNGSSEELIIDLTAVTRADSAALALLIGWVRRAQAAGVSAVFKGIPGQLLEIARVSGVEDILPVAKRAG